MRIGLVSTHSFLKPGGVKKHILALQKEFKKRGHSCKIIVPRRSQKENYGRDIILLGTSFTLPMSGTQTDFALNFTPGAIDRVLKKEKFDIVHFHNLGFSSWQILENPNLDSIRVLTWHASLEGSKVFKLFPFVKNLLLNVVKEKIDGILGVAPFNLELFKNINKPKAVIPNGIDLAEFNPKNPKIQKYCDGKTNLLFLGRFEKRKGLIYLLRAFKTLKKKYLNLRLIIVGGGPEKDDCEDFVKSNKLQDVIFEGEKPDFPIPSYYITADIYISPATHGESFGIVLLEAMASGTPVVAFANQGYKLVMEGKYQDFLAKPKAWRSLAQRIEILIRDEKKRKEMREFGLKLVQKYSWDKIAGQVLEFYNKVKLEVQK